MKLVELVSQRKKFFAQQRVEAKRNKPMTHAQQKEYMSNYIKNQEGGYSIKQLKSLSFEQVKDIFETTIMRVRYPIIDWEVYFEDTRRDDLVKIWDLVKERFSTTEPIDDKEKELWVELKRLGHDIFMLVKKEYPLTRGTLGLMMVARLLVKADKGLIQKLDELKVNHKFWGGLLGIRGFYNLMLLVQVCAAVED
ncbi:hypothetical protein Tco_0808186 [Tanacetum coccineum]